MRTADPRARGAGFTLVELMVSLLIGAILIGVVFQMISGQTRIAAVQSGREEAQQNARGALEVLSSELRSAVPRGIVDAQRQSLTFMQPRAWGLLCTDATNPLNTEFFAVFPNTGGDAPWQAGQANGVLALRGGDWVPDPAGFPQRARIVSSQVVAAADCPLGPAGDVVVVRLTTSEIVGGLQGDRVALYALTRYDLGTGQGGTWLRRSNSLSSADVFAQQPLAGPLQADRFRFEYLGANGVDLGEPGTNAAVLANVRQVRVQVVTNSTQRLNNLPQRDSGTAVVTLRN